MSCGFLRKSAVFCDLQLPSAAISRRTNSWKNQRKSANLAPFVPFSLSLLLPFGSRNSMGFPRISWNFLLTRLVWGAHQGGHATTRFLEGFLEGSLKEVLLRRVLCKRRVRFSVQTRFLEGFLEGSVVQKALKRCLELGMPLPLAGVKIPKIGKRGFRSQKNHFPTPQKKGVASQKLTNFRAPFFKEIPFFLFCVATPSKTLATPQPLNIVFPLGNGGVLRSEEGGGD